MPDQIRQFVELHGLSLHPGPGNGDIERQAVVAEALTWRRTPYHHRASIKGVGVDCAHFPVAVYSACGLIQPIDVDDYPPDWHMHRNEERYLNKVRSVATEIDMATVGPGDFVLFKVGRCYAHGAIVIEWPRIIHAVLGLGVTAGSAYDGMTASKPVKAFTLWSSTDDKAD